MRKVRALLALALACPSAAVELGSRPGDRLPQAPAEAAALPQTVVPSAVNIEGVPGAQASAPEAVVQAPEAAVPSAVLPAAAQGLLPAVSASAVPGEASSLSASSIFDGAVKRKLDESYHFRRLWLQNLYWYSVTHISGGKNPTRGLWSKFHSKLIVAQADGAALPVSSHRRFFSHMRVMGQTGRFYVLGFAPRGDEEVLHESRETFKKYFDSLEVGPEEETAFERLLDRVVKYNRRRRNQTNLRKHIRDTMLRASVTPVDKLVEFFDGLFREDVRDQTNDFQKNGGQQKALDAFRQAILQTIAEEDPSAKDRVVGAVLLGSFASGGATARSDFDVEPLTANGGASRIKGFEKRMTVRWKQLGFQRANPVTFKDFPDPASRAVIDRIHYFDYLVISPFPDLVNALERKHGESPTFMASQKMGRWGPLQRKLEYWVVYWTTVWTDLKALFA